MTADDLLARNLAALRTHNPEAAEVLSAVEPAGLDWSITKGGDATARRLGSRYDPRGEAERLLKPLDAEDADTAAAVLLGLGLAYHAEPALKKVGPRGLLIAYEPAPSQLAAVLRKIDHAAWLGAPNLRLLLGEPDAAEVTRRLESASAVVTQGMTLIAHPPTRSTYGDAVGAFAKALAESAAFFRTNVATTLVITARTTENQARNLAHYAAGPGTDSLHRAAEGRPAVCVAAGPSLAKNAHLLCHPGLRGRVVVIAAQTALKPLLQRGVRPDYVTALDYSPINVRFYEGLPPLPDVTLVAEAKAYPAVIDGFPGPVRLIPSTFANDLLRGSGLDDRQRTPLRSGSTVAHLSLYLAEHLACEPIVLVGQDLAFSDGLYYCPGTAAHDVWDCELNPYHSLENLEWIRIARMGGNLKRREDTAGRPIFTDEQMLTYLMQFEQEFGRLESEGRAVIDATEGGVRKRHVEAEPLADVLAEVAQEAVPPLPEVPLNDAGRTRLDPHRLDLLRAHLTRRRGELDGLADTCRVAAGLLNDLERSLDRPPSVKRDEPLTRLSRKLDREKSRVAGELKDVFELVNQVNTLGAYQRARSDRRIDQAGDAGETRTRRQLERDRANMALLEEATRQVRGHLVRALADLSDVSDLSATAEAPVEA